MQTKTETESYFHEMQEDGYFEAGIVLPLDNSGKKLAKATFFISLKPDFLGVVGNGELFNQTNHLLKLDLLAYLLDQFGDWLNYDLDYEIQDLTWNRKPHNTIRFTVQAQINGKKEELIFEFTQGQATTIVFTSSHRDETSMQVAITVVRDWLVQQLMTTIV